ncbi:piggyBac transposable element-derived protein 4-like [Melanaphis sacchari]|uniref:piggyBac transposable element-derived protein 4-like n=1 Tax=Melanaphis sacchari TaxID=742174 RepID=UPI000DC1373D|nr:piggyBac transposable element-derived protein 4-like [Melanaphis sacchari]
MKWKDKRDVLMLSTKDKDNIETTTNKRAQQLFKPQMILDYNKAKGFVDISDLRGSYHSPLRRSLKWYRKIAFKILLNTSLLNALTLNNSVTGNKIGVTKFRENIAQVLLTKSKILNTNEGESHKLIHSKRGRCSNCYFEMVH